jgi:hypothetical protein
MDVSPYGPSFTQACGPVTCPRLVPEQTEPAPLYWSPSTRLPRRAQPQPCLPGTDHLAPLTTSHPQSTVTRGQPDSGGLDTSDSGGLDTKFGQRFTRHLHFRLPHTPRLDSDGPTSPAHARHPATLSAQRLMAGPRSPITPGPHSGSRTSPPPQQWSC